MPAGYERMRDSFARKGMAIKAAKRKAARLWNAAHPGNPVTRSHGKRPRMGRPKRKR